MFDAKDPLKILYKTRSGTGHIEYSELPGATKLLGIKELADGKTSWQLIYYREDPQSGTHILAMPPKLRELRVWSNYSGNQKDLWAVAVDAPGKEPQLWLPLSPDGKLAWFPEGVVGLRAFWPARVWLVKWLQPHEGWSITHDLNQISLDGPRWKSFRLLDKTGEFVDDTKEPWQILFVYGELPDGRCEIASWEGTRSMIGATCAEAQKTWNATLDAERAKQSAEIAKAQAQAKKAEAYAPVTWTAPSSPEERRRTAEWPTANRYRQLVDGQWNTAKLPPRACDVAKQLSIDGHLEVIEYRAARGMLLVDELDCLSARGLTQAQGTRISNLIRGFKAYGRTTTTGGTAQTTPGYDEAAKQREELLRRSIEYTNGRTGVCPFKDRSLCR